MSHILGTTEHHKVFSENVRKESLLLIVNDGLSLSAVAHIGSPQRDMIGEKGMLF